MGGNSSKKNKDLYESRSRIKEFKLEYILGCGGFGQVWKVEKIANQKSFAMKQMYKSEMINKCLVSSVLNEKKLLQQINNPLLVNMDCSFQDYENLYLVCDLMIGGDFRYYMKNPDKFVITEEKAKFIIACLILGLEYLHSIGVIHRDIKPDNILLDGEGYVHIGDFGISRVWHPNNSSDVSGTLGYMSPEVMCGRNHGIAVDIFSLGVVAYELMLNKKPYIGLTRLEIKNKMLESQVEISMAEIPNGWSKYSADFINKCLIRKPSLRIGSSGPHELKSHLWFNNIKWEEIKQFQVVSPLREDVIKRIALREKIPINDEIEKNKIEKRKNQLLLRKSSLQEMFKEYDY